MRPRGQRPGRWRESPRYVIGCNIEEAIHRDAGAPSRGASQGIVARGRVVEEVEDGVGPLAAHRQGPGGIRPRQGRPQNEDKGIDGARWVSEPTRAGLSLPVPVHGATVSCDARLEVPEAPPGGVADRHMLDADGSQRH